MGCIGADEEGRWNACCIDTDFYMLFLSNSSFIAERRRLHPNCNAQFTSEEVTAFHCDLTRGIDEHEIQYSQSVNTSNERSDIRRARFESSLNQEVKKKKRLSRDRAANKSWPAALKTPRAAPATLVSTSLHKRKKNEVIFTAVDHRMQRRDPSASLNRNAP